MSETNPLIEVAQKDLHPSVATDVATPPNASLKIFLNVDFSEKDEAKRLGARWDFRQKKWYVPAGHDLAPFTRWLPVNTNPVPPKAPDALITPLQGISLHELIGQVRSAVRQALPEMQWVRAEIARIDDRFNSNVFLELVERDQAREVASIKAAIWNAEPVLTRFSQQTGHLLAADMQVLVLARVEVQDRFGLRLIIAEIDPAYTVGVMANQLQMIRQTLQQEKMIDNNRQRPLPNDFFNVAVISPESAAGLGDFRAGADPLARFQICQFHYLTAIFQGPKTKDSLLTAFHQALALPALDALVILRGGGAVADLHWLNKLELARAICRSPIPVITGIGHQKDQTILDEVARRAEGTPSKVIAFIRETIRQRAAQTHDDFNTIQAGIERRLTQADHQIEHYQQTLRIAARRALLEAGKTVDRRWWAISDQVHRWLAFHQRALADLLQRHIIAHSHSRIARAADATAALREQVQAGAWRWQRWATKETHRLLREILGQSPENTLRRGFALVRDDAHHPVTSRAAASRQPRLTLEFHDGSLPVRRENLDERSST
jgi:exodeoxyribonuclease VII large subunit